MERFIPMPRAYELETAPRSRGTLVAPMCSMMACRNWVIGAASLLIACGGGTDASGGSGPSSSAAAGGAPATSTGTAGGSTSESASTTGAGGMTVQEILFDMYQSGSYPNYAWDGSPAGSDANGVYFSVSQLAGEAPSGHDAVRITGIGVPSGPQSVDCDWAVPADFGTVTQGAARYARWSMRLSGPQNWERVSGGRAGHKAFILGNNCECYSTPTPSCLNPADNLGPTRVIVHEEGFTPTAPFTEVHMFGDQNIGCGGGGFNVGLDCSTQSAPNQGIVYPQNDTWYRIQVKVQSSSDEATADGYIAIWVRPFGDTSSYSESAPDAISGDTFILKTTGWWDNPACGGASIVWGPATLHPLSTSATFVQDWADFQLAATFDSTWANP